MRVLGGYEERGGNNLFLRTGETFNARNENLPPGRGKNTGRGKMTGLILFAFLAGGVTGWVAGLAAAAYWARENCERCMGGEKR